VSLPRTSALVLALVGSLTVQGCRSKQADQADQADQAVEATVPATCAERVAAMRATFDPHLGQSSLLASMTPTSLQPGEGELVTAEVIVTITELEVHYLRDTLGSIGQPGELVPSDGLARLRARLERERPRLIAFAFSQRATWPAIAEALDAAADVGARVEILVVEFAPEPPSIDPSRDSVQSRMLAVERAIGGCQAALQVWQPDEHSDDFTDDLLRELPGAVESCACVGDVEQLTREIEQLTTPITMVRAVTLEPGSANAVTIRRAPDARWSEVAAEVLAAAPHVRLQFDGPELEVPPEPEPEPEPEPPRPKPAAN
jgi:hypothetical protein